MLTDQFDVEALAQQLKRMGARYFVLTLGQNSGYFNAPSAVYDRMTGYAAGELTEPPDIVPASRWLDGSQWHALTYTGSNWAERNLRFTDEQWANWVKAVVAHGGVVTLDMGLNRDANAGPIGAIAEAQVKQGVAIKTAIGKL